MPALARFANKLATADLPVTDASGSLSGGSGSGVPAPAMGSTGSKCERPSLAEGTEQLDQLTGGIPVAAGRDAQSVRPFNARPWALLCVMILLPAASFLYGGGKYPGQSGSEGSSPVITKDLIPYDPANSRLRLEFRPSTRVAFCREHSDEVHNPVVEDLCDTLWWLMEEIPQPREESVTELEVLGVVLGFILVLLP
ncbi:hypothetical protein KEM54_000153 [Ascosphaera aggregata]|nr:hypothetical protein KEM54_000153 [Ascosphaera aggregata]